MSNVRWYAAWAVVVAVLIAVPVAAVMVHHHTADAVTVEAFAPPSASPTPTPSPSPTPSEDPTAAPDLVDVPLCANVWQRGRMLALHYTGCQDRGTVVKPQRDDCLVSYRDRMWAQPGHDIRRADGSLGADRHYAVALAHC